MWEILIGCFSYMHRLEIEPTTYESALIWDLTCNLGMCPDLALPTCMYWLGIEPATLWCTGQCSDQLSHTSQGEIQASYYGFELAAVLQVSRLVDERM